MALNEEPVIDAWAQHPTLPFVAHEMFASLRRWMGMTELPESIPLQLTASAMESAGVRRALLSAWWGPEGVLISNEEVAACVKQRPDLFLGVASVDIRRPMEAVRELRRAVRNLGFKALRILPWLWELPPNDRRYYPLYAECVELGIPFCLQVGHAGPLKPSDPGRPIPYLDEVALDFPELTIVGGHIGYPWENEMIALATKYENVYIDTSAYKPNRFPPSLVAFMKGHGRDKVLFGSNYPMILPSDCLSQLDALDLDADTRKSFLHDNARRVFRIESS